MSTLSVIPIPGLPLVQPGDDLVAIVCDAMDKAGLNLQKQGLTP